MKVSRWREKGREMRRLRFSSDIVLTVLLSKKLIKSPFFSSLCVCVCFFCWLVFVSIKNLQCPAVHFLMTESLWFPVMINLFSFFSLHTHSHILVCDSALADKKKICVSTHALVIQSLMKLQNFTAVSCG